MQAGVKTAGRRWFDPGNGLTLVRFHGWKLIKYTPEDHRRDRGRSLPGQMNRWRNKAPLRAELCAGHRDNRHNRQASVYPARRAEEGCQAVRPKSCPGERIFECGRPTQQSPSQPGRFTPLPKRFKARYSADSNRLPQRWRLLMMPRSDKRGANLQPAGADEGWPGSQNHFHSCILEYIE